MKKEWNEWTIIKSKWFKKPIPDVYLSSYKIGAGAKNGNYILFCVSNNEKHEHLFDFWIDDTQKWNHKEVILQALYNHNCEL